MFKKLASSVFAVSFICLAACGCSSMDKASKLKVKDSFAQLEMPGHAKYTFVKDSQGSWSWDKVYAWSDKKQAFVSAYTTEDGNFLSVDKTGDFDFKADSIRVIEQADKQGLEFSGAAGKDSPVEWKVSFTADKNMTMPFVKISADFRYAAEVKLDDMPYIFLKTLSKGDETSRMANIMGYFQGYEDRTILLEQGFPAVWTLSEIDGKTFSTAAIVDTNQKARNGELVKKAFYLGRTEKSMPSASKFVFRNVSTEKVSAGDRGSISVELRHSAGADWLEFYRSSWPDVISRLCHPDDLEFWAKNWQQCAKGLMDDYKDPNNYIYTPGLGYAIGSGGQHIHWFVATQFVHGILYYSWATDDKENYDFLVNRMKECDIHKWWVGPEKTDGLMWGKNFPDGGVQPQGNMWQMLNFGAYPVWHIYRITGDEYYGEFFYRYMDYIMDEVVTDGTFGEWWDVNKRKWVFWRDGGFHDSRPSDHLDFPGALAVYTYLCFQAYHDSGDEKYRDSAFGYVEHINSFLDDPARLYTIAPDTKTNGFAFAMMSNIEMYKLTKKPVYLDNAEEWAYNMLVMYFLQNEQYGNEVGLARAGGQGKGEFGCIPTFETMQPINLLSNLLKYRVSDTFLKFMSIADRRYLNAFGVNHPNYKTVEHWGVFRDGRPWEEFLYLPLEVIPRGSDPATYMGGAPMMLNAMLHATHECSDDEVTVILTDAGSTSLDIKSRRNVIIYNPTRTKRTFTVKFKGLEQGNYSLISPGGRETVSSDRLKAGFEFTLDAESWDRIFMEKQI
jgi:hypothetical protein